MNEILSGIISYGLLAEGERYHCTSKLSPEVEGFRRHIERNMWSVKDWHMSIPINMNSLSALELAISEDNPIINFFVGDIIGIQSLDMQRSVPSSMDLNYDIVTFLAARCTLSQHPTRGHKAQGKDQNLN